MHRAKDTGTDIQEKLAAGCEHFGHDILNGDVPKRAVRVASCTGVLKRAARVGWWNTQEQTVDARTRAQLKVIMTHLLETIYVSPEIGKQLGSQLRAKFESGAYKDVATPTQLAEALTHDLRELGKDWALIRQI